MLPQNRSDRKKAFLNFLLLFSLCIVIIITTVFFSIQVPLKENNYLRREVETMNQEREFSTRFMNQFIKSARTLDTINKTSTMEADRLEARIKEDIGKLDAMVSDTTFNKDFYLNVSHNMGFLQASLKELRDKSGQVSDDNSNKQAIKELQDKVDQYREKWIECSMGKK